MSSRPILVCVSEWELGAGSVHQNKNTRRTMCEFGSIVFVYKFNVLCKYRFAGGWGVFSRYIYMPDAVHRSHCEVIETNK